jgi:hypothetical protein
MLHPGGILLNLIDEARATSGYVEKDMSDELSMITA